MRGKELMKAERRVIALQKQMAELGPVMRGSVVVIGVRNKQPYFSCNKDGKTRLIYLGKKRARLARQYSENYKKLRNIIEKITELNMLLLKKNYAATRR